MNSVFCLASCVMTKMKGAEVIRPVLKLQESALIVPGDDVSITAMPSSLVSVFSGWATEPGAHTLLAQHQKFHVKLSWSQAT